LQFSQDQTVRNIEKTTAELQQYQTNLNRLDTELSTAEETLTNRQTERDQTLAILNQTRDDTSNVAEQAEAWMQEQTELHRNIETWQKTLNPQRTEQARLREKVNLLQKQTEEQQQSLTQLQTEYQEKQDLLNQQRKQQQIAQEQVQSLAQIVTAAEAELKLQQETQTRLFNEQRERQRQLDKLEAQQQAQQEAAGTYATKMVMQSGLPGVCGLVCQLGRVEPDYQLALEIAAGGRLGHLVVEDDGVAAAGIELLKRKQAGRATFLPLNKIRGNRSGINRALMRSTEGLIDYAVNLIECEPRYQDIFAYVFGNTMVFNRLENARRYIGQYRMVTLEGELLEASGAMTGGSHSRRSTFHFGTEETTSEADKVKALKNRLEEIERILDRCHQTIIQAGDTAKARSQELIESRQNYRDIQQGVNQLETEINRLNSQLEKGQHQFNQNTQELNSSLEQLKILDHEIPLQESQLQKAREMLAQLEDAHRHSEWQQMQQQIRVIEAELQQKEEAVKQVQQEILGLKNQQQRLTEKQEEGNQSLREDQKQKQLLSDQIKHISDQINSIKIQMSETQAALKTVEASLGEEKQKRDQVETQLRDLRLAQQQLEWQIQKLQETQLGRREQFNIKQEQLQAQQAELPEPLPEMPTGLDLATLQRELRSLQKQMEALEPVNMLALEEYERTQGRLDELSQKLATLEGERTELLLRIENFTTLRQRAFQEAFDAVNENFQTIFAELSDGDGYLEIDDPEDPFSSGLNLIAHPKGKPVQRLASMSGGEKSLTALSFIFALQRYRPSPFYAFDEVDMFLDGANVERLAKMIKRQAQQAQFIVVSLRRPMMEASERTIGVTQARGAYTQVLGLQL
jgi:chromosome segregation protein